MDEAEQTQMPKHSPKSQPRKRPENPRCPPSRAQSLLTPRPYEEIYHERAYLTTYLQQKTQRIEGLIREYSETETQLNLGAEGKTRRRLRKLLNLLRCKLDEASQQERAIFSRMGELYMELNSRGTWERARMASGSTQYGARQARPADDEYAGTPVTPCLSFASSEWSAASSAVPESPVASSTSELSDAQVRQSHDEFALPRCLASEYLETVPEEMEETAKTPISTNLEGDIDADSFQTSNKEPEIGDLEYDYVQDNNQEGGGEEANNRTTKPRGNRLSLPVMQFTWPDS